MRGRDAVSSRLVYFLTVALVVIGGAEGETIYVSNDISSDRTWISSNRYILSNVVKVTSGVTLTIQRGTTIYARRSTLNGIPASLIILQGSKIMANGTAKLPITFTVEDEIASPINPTTYDSYGLWGGVIICGYSPINGGNSRVFNGFGDIRFGEIPIRYGGRNEADNSGILRYVRVWFAGASSAAQNSGLTLAAVGSRTIIEDVEVGFGRKCGFSLLGGSVNLRRCSSIFNKGGAFFIAEGYQGRMQFLLGIVDQDTDFGVELTSENLVQRRTFPQIYGMTIIKAQNYSRFAGPFIRVREGAGGRLANVLLHGYGIGLKVDDCGPNTLVSSDPGQSMVPNFLYFAPGNIVDNANLPIFDANCTGTTSSSNAENATALAQESELILVPVGWRNFSDFLQLDPRPITDTNAYSSVERVPSTDSSRFFNSVKFKGAFGDLMWIDQWSWLSVRALLPAKEAAPSQETSLCGRISTSKTLSASQTYYLRCQTFVEEGATLFIEPGVTIKAYRQDQNGTSTALVIRRGARLEAKGTAKRPITFTSVLPEHVLPRRGTWGGIIILGRAPISTAGGENYVEGLRAPLGAFGGNVSDDNSGTLSHVRVWYGGADIEFSYSAQNSGQEINGLTLAGVGNGTTVEHCEVAFNLDDGFEMFGGTVNLKWCSSIFNGDDAFDADEGYQGKWQQLFALVDVDGDRASEIDSKTNGDLNASPRTFVELNGATFIRSNHPSNTSTSIMNLREGAGGSFSNIILTGVAGYGMKNTDCGAESHTSSTPPFSSNMSFPDYLFWSPGNIIDTSTDGITSAFSVASSCSWANNAPSSRQVDPNLRLAPPKMWTQWSNIGQTDPRPLPDGNAYANVSSTTTTTSPSSSVFSAQPTSVGAFDQELWLDHWSWLSVKGLIPSADTLPVAGVTLCGNITTNMTLSAVNKYYLTCPTFVKAPAVLTVAAGTTVRAYMNDAAGRTCSLVVEPGARIVANGNRNLPITFTSVLSPMALPKRGTWGGLIILGDARTNAKNPGESTVPGAGAFGSWAAHSGGNIASSSSSSSSSSFSVLRYVRVWYAGRTLVGDDNVGGNSNSEGSGLVLAGVGSGSTVEHTEVAYSQRDGFLILGGDVNLRFCSSVMNGNDAISTNFGYSGRMQFIFAAVYDGGRHALKMVSHPTDFDAQPRSFPRIYSATFIRRSFTKAPIVELFGGMGGHFGSIIVLGQTDYGVRVSGCGLSVQRTILSEGPEPNSLYFARQNIVYTQSVDSVASQPFFSDCDWVNGPMVKVVDPELILGPILSGEEEGLRQLDPRPIDNSNSYLSAKRTSDAFFVVTTYSGAFARDLWLEGWSYLSEHGILPSNEYPEASAILCGSLTADTKLSSELTYYILCRVVVEPGVTLTIQPGTVIKAYMHDSTGRPAALVVRPGAKLVAQGLQDSPITFTSVLPDKHLPKRGSWGGVFLLGRATIGSLSSSSSSSSSSTGISRSLPSLTSSIGSYGGTIDTDNSGALAYVRIWYGGCCQADESKVHGLTLAAVGSETVIENCEVAFSLNNGVDIRGGRVGLSHVVSLFNGVNGFQVSEGYRGRLAYLFSLTDTLGLRAFHCTSDELEQQATAGPKTRVELLSSTLIGNPSGTYSTVRFSKGCSGVVSASVIVNPVAGGGVGLEQGLCVGNQTYSATNVLPSQANTSAISSTLYLDPANIIFASQQFSLDGSCTPFGSLVANTTLRMVLLPDYPSETLKMIDPRQAGGIAESTASDLWFRACLLAHPPFLYDKEACGEAIGAFSTKDLWLSRWSYLSAAGKLPGNEKDIHADSILCGNITTNLTLSGGEAVYYLTCQTFVKNGAVLTVLAGATIKAYAQTPNGDAPTLVVTRGSKIIADGTPDMPITFTSALPEAQLPRRASWGGLIVLGNAPIYGGGVKHIEGLATNNDGLYGGDSPDESSGVLRYVRIWNGGAQIGHSTMFENSGNEINGLTLAGVGSGTIVEYCEVAFNLDDGFEIFGGRVNLRYVSSIFNGDDAFDIDEGYQGKLQFLFCLVGELGDSCLEINSGGAGNESFPQIYGATLVGGSPTNLQDRSLIRIREDTGGAFGNLVLSNAKGVEIGTCVDKKLVTAWPTSSLEHSDFLYFSRNNIIYNSHDIEGFQQFSYDTACSARTPSFSALTVDPKMRRLPYDASSSIVVQSGVDPRALVCGPLYQDVDTPPPTSNGWFAAVNYKGAFGSRSWLDLWSFVAQNSALGPAIPWACSTANPTVLRGEIVFHQALICPAGAIVESVASSNLSSTASPALSISGQHLYAKLRSVLEAKNLVAAVNIRLSVQCGPITTTVVLEMIFNGPREVATTFAENFSNFPQKTLGEELVLLYGAPQVSIALVGGQNIPALPTPAPTNYPTPSPTPQRVRDSTLGQVYLGITVAFMCTIACLIITSSIICVTEIKKSSVKLYLNILFRGDSKQISVESRESKEEHTSMERCDDSLIGMSVLRRRGRLSSEIELQGMSSMKSSMKSSNHQQFNI